MDALAGYLYLIRPPPGAKHKAVDPAHLVVSGDSFGGNVVICLLTILRDLGLPLPAGAVLISPWSDMTHSAKSVLQNTATDIIPPYSFIHKPSTLWPVPGVKPESGKDGKGSHEQSSRMKEAANSERKSQDKSDDPQIPPPLEFLWSQPIKLEVKDPVLQEQFGKEINLKGQIQLYATNDQITHPIVSPLLHGSLGGLPPLYILAGDSEVLRDEIIRECLTNCPPWHAADLLRHL